MKFPVSGSLNNVTPVDSPSLSTKSSTINPSYVEFPVSVLAIFLPVNADAFFPVEFPLESTNLKKLPS